MFLYPPHLYKILSLEHWDMTRSKDDIHLSKEDELFIHLSTEEQLHKIISKYWAQSSNYIILKVKTDVLKGRLVLESNPGGVSKYFHLYEGAIPINAVIGFKMIGKR